MRPDADGIVVVSRTPGETTQASVANRSHGDRVRTCRGVLRFELPLAFARRSRGLCMHSQNRARGNAAVRFDPALAYAPRSCIQRMHDHIRAHGDAVLALARPHRKHPRSQRRTPIYWNQKSTPHRRAVPLPRSNSSRV
jgi:hypothetical protein